jgi:hypothetical protein
MRTNVIHQDEWKLNAKQRVSDCAQSCVISACSVGSPRLESKTISTGWRSDNVTGEAGFEAKECGESRNAGLGCRWIDLFAGGERFSNGRAGC